MTGKPGELLQFPCWRYNEKARRALDVERVSPVRRSLFPGPRAIRVMLASGQTQVPVLRLDGWVINESARIIDELERKFPNLPLYPAASAARRPALEIQHQFAEEVGPQVRLVLFFLMLHEADCVCRMTGSECGPITRTLHHGASSLLRPVIAKRMGIAGKEPVECALRNIENAFGFVSKRCGQDLVGKTFTVAELAAASVVAPVGMPADSPMDLPKPRPPCVLEWLSRRGGYPRTEWGRHQYRKSRRPSAKVAKKSGKAKPLWRKADPAGFPLKAPVARPDTPWVGPKESFSGHNAPRALGSFTRSWSWPFDSSPHPPKQKKPPFLFCP